MHEEAAARRGRGGGREAFVGWRGDEGARREGLRGAAAAIMESQDELADILSAEQGKPVPAAAYEVSQAALWLEVSVGGPASAAQGDPG